MGSSDKLYLHSESTVNGNTLTVKRSPSAFICRLFLQILFLKVGLRGMYLLLLSQSNVLHNLWEIIEFTDKKLVGTHNFVVKY